MFARLESSNFMRPTSIGFRSLVVLAAASLASAATSVSSNSLVSSTTLAIDGALAARLLSWEGGDFRSSVVVQPSTTGSSPTKSPGAPFCAPLVVQVAFPPPPALVKWINELCASQSPRRKLVLTDYNATGVAIEAFEAIGAMLTEVTFPAFDATTAPIGPMRLVFSAEQSRVTTPGGSSGGLAAGPTSASTFSLAVDGLDASATMRIEPITVTMASGSSATGATRTYATTTGSTEFSNLRVQTSAAKADTWKTWLTDFVVNGRSTDANEKRGSVRLIGANGAPLDLALNFSQIGILRVSRLPIASGTLPKVEAEFYFERLSLDSPSASSTGTSTNASSGTESAIKATELPPPGPIASTQTERPVSGTNATAGIRTPIAGTVLLTSPTVAPAIVATAPSAADQGSRDPAAFPRVEGLTRISYSGTYQKTYTNEQASYSSPETIYQLVGRVDVAAKAAGWTLTSLSEADSPNGKTVSESWTRPSATASVSFQGLKDGSGAKLSIAVYVQIPAAN